MSNSLQQFQYLLALLRDVAGEDIVRNYFADGEFDMTSSDDAIVRSRIAEAERAGWVYLDEERWTVVDPFSGAHWERRFWRLTDAGRAVLDAHGGAR